MKKNYDNFHTFVRCLLKRHYPNASMSTECKDILNHLIRNLGVKYINGCVSLCRYCKKATIDSNAIKTLTKIWLKNPEQLLDFAHNVWDTYSHTTDKGLKKHKRAGLSLPPARFKELFNSYRGANQKIGEPAYIFLTAIIEALIIKILDEAILLVTVANKKMVCGVHIYTALNSNAIAEYRSLFDNVVVAGFGYIGNSHSGQ